MLDVLVDDFEPDILRVLIAKNHKLVSRGVSLPKEGTQTGTGPDPRIFYHKM
jgi:hypothetical protein